MWRIPGDKDHVTMGWVRWGGVGWEGEVMVEFMSKLLLLIAIYKSKILL